MAKTHDKVGPRYAPGYRRRGHEREQIPIIAVNIRKELQHARPQVESFNGGRDRAALVKEGEEARLRPAPAEHFEALFPAAHSSQPIVSQDDAWLAGCVHAISVLGGPADLARLGSRVYRKLSSRPT